MTCVSLPLPNYRWHPVLLLEPGMVVARPVVGTTGVRATLLLGPGTVLTADTIAQLINRGVECVATVCEGEHSVQSDATLARSRARLDEIFGPSPDEACQRLYDALLKSREASC